MNMDDEKNNTLPDGYEATEDRLNEAKERLTVIDSQIASVPKEHGPTLRYDPPHYVGRIIPGTRHRTIAGLEEQKEQIRSEALAKTEADTRDGDHKAGRVVRDHVRQELYPNPFREISPEDKARFKGEKKEIEQSQDYMDSLFTAKNDQIKDTAEPTQNMPEKQKSLDVSVSVRFSQNLSFTKAREKTDGTPNKTPDRDIDRD